MNLGVEIGLTLSTGFVVVALVSHMVSVVARLFS